MYKSGKQRKAEIKQARLNRILKHRGNIDPMKRPIPEWAVPVDKDAVVYHSTFIGIPNFYIDKKVTCKDCGAAETWTGKQQKWWYEIAKGNLETTAVRCNKCRKEMRRQKAEQKKHMEEMAKRKPHQNEEFFKNT